MKFGLLHYHRKECMKCKFAAKCNWNNSNEPCLSFTEGVPNDEGYITMGKLFQKTDFEESFQEVKLI